MKYLMIYNNKTNKKITCFVFLRVNVETFNKGNRFYST